MGSQFFVRHDSTIGDCPCLRVSCMAVVSVVREQYAVGVSGPSAPDEMD